MTTLKERVDKILKLNKNRTQGSYTHARAAFYPDDKNEYDAVYIKPFHRKFPCSYGIDVKRIILSNITYEQETERGRCYLLSDVLRRGDAEFLASAPEMVAIIEEQQVALNRFGKLTDALVDMQINPPVVYKHDSEEFEKAMYDQILSLRARIRELEDELEDELETGSL